MNKYKSFVDLGAAFEKMKNEQYGFNYKGNIVSEIPNGKFKMSGIEFNSLGEIDDYLEGLYANWNNNIIKQNNG